jgi:hypothetical protein
MLGQGSGGAEEKKPCPDSLRSLMKRILKVFAGKDHSSNKHDKSFGIPEVWLAFQTTSRVTMTDMNLK